MTPMLYILSGFCLAFAIASLAALIAFVKLTGRLSARLIRARAEAEFHKRVAQSNYEACQKLSAILAQQSAASGREDDDADWWKKGGKP